MSNEPLKATRDGHILRVVINRPEKRNALSRAMLDSLREVFETNSEIPHTKVAVISGAGDKSFAAGGDLADLASVRSESETRKMSTDGWRALNAVRNFPVPVVAALNGDALGGGAELAVACDFRVAASHARIGFLQSRLNISSAWGGAGDLFDLVGRTRALRLLCTAELVSPTEALAMGLFDRCADSDSGFTNTLESFLELMTDKSSQVLRAYKSMATQVRLSASRETLDRVERDAFVGTWTHPDHWSAADDILSKSN